MEPHRRAVLYGLTGALLATGASAQAEGYGGYRIQRKFVALDGVTYALARTPLVSPFDLLVWNGGDTRERYRLLREAAGGWVPVGQWNSHSGKRLEDVVPGPRGATVVFRRRRGFQVRGPGRSRYQLGRGASAALAERSQGGVHLLVASETDAVYVALDERLREVARQVFLLEGPLAPPVLTNLRRLEYRGGSPVFEVRRTSFPGGAAFQARVEGEPGSAALSEAAVEPTRSR